MEKWAQRTTTLENITWAHFFLDWLYAHDVPPEYVLEIISYEYEYRNTYIYMDIYYILAY